jgi:hypothetical protein
MVTDADGTGRVHGGGRFKAKISNAFQNLTNGGLRGKAHGSIRIQEGEPN